MGEQTSSDNGVSADAGTMLNDSANAQAAYEAERVIELGGKPGDAYYPTLIKTTADEQAAYEAGQVEALGGKTGDAYYPTLIENTAAETAREEAALCTRVNTQVKEGIPHEQAYIDALAQIGWDRSNVLACAPAGWLEEFQHGVTTNKSAPEPSKDTIPPR